MKNLRHDLKKIIIKLNCKITKKGKIKIEVILIKKNIAFHLSIILDFNTILYSVYFYIFLIYFISINYLIHLSITNHSRAKLGNTERSFGQIANKSNL